MAAEDANFLILQGRMAGLRAGPAARCPYERADCRRLFWRYGWRGMKPPPRRAHETVSRGARTWTDREVAALELGAGLPAATLAGVLGRTVSSVKLRQHRLRKERQEAAA